MRAVLSVVSLVLASTVVAPAAADPIRQVCEAAVPAVNKTGFRPGQVVTYTFVPSPGGEPFPDAMVACVDRAFDGWTAANRATGLDVRFERGGTGVAVRFGKPGGLALPPRRAAAWGDEERGPDGALERAHIWLSTERDIVESCVGITKVVLHELGHLHGLADNDAAGGPSVMNQAKGKDDRGGYLPLAPTRCDARQALRAAVVGSR